MASDMNFLTATMIGREAAMLHWEKMGRKVPLHEWRVESVRSGEDVIVSIALNVESVSFPVSLDQMGWTLHEFSPRVLAPAMRQLPSWIDKEKREQKIKRMRARAKCRGPIRLAT